ncbi:MAG: hypothetical protein RL071_254 [Pseudomonadota bacterium]
MGRYNTKTPARVQVLLARDAPHAVVLRRGPSHVVCSLGWDRRDDSFTLGQWYHGRIYFEKCDIAPDGVHWIYFALNGKRHEPTLGAYTVLARAPYLKALGLWPVGSTWGGGGLFSEDGDYWPFHDAPLIAPPEAPRLSSDFLDRRDWPRGTHQHARLVRDGWVLVHKAAREDDPYVDVFERPIPAGWVLVRACHLRHEAFTLRHGPSGRVLALPDWEWAERDGERLVWSAAGCLWAADIDATGLVRPRVLQDFNAMVAHRTRAPY